ncbi:MAG: ATP-binding cassette domain-containing protein, partial [Puniceicoccales bacterium]|nr:ATP-binding cassette domain-containing protein [Puniceicoccales bacterium]
MLQAKDLTYQIGSRTLFEDITFTIPDGAKVGIVGPNGAGKTTLFQLILGKIFPDKGEVSHPKKYRFAHVCQEIKDTHKTALELLLDGDSELARLREMLHNDDGADVADLADLYEQFVDIGGLSGEARAATILAGLGFSETSMRQPLHTFSGGWRVRAALAVTLFAPSDCLLLDEPTNHLDFETAIWLEDHLCRMKKTLCVISHEKKFLNRVCDHILYVHDGTAQLFRGNYDTFRATDENLRRARESENASLERKREHMQEFVDKFRYKASKAKQAQSRMKMLEKLEKPPPALAAYSVSFQFPAPAPRIDCRFVAMEHISLGYDGREVLRDVNFQINDGDRIALLGANGNGKSTLAKAVARQIAPQSGEMSWARSLKIAYFAQHQEEILDLQKTPVEIFREVCVGQTETQVRSQLARFGLIRERSLTRTEYLSGGEKTRLLLAIATLPQPHLLVLDEPTNHLDIEAREALATAIQNYQGAVLLVTHDFQTLADTCRDFYVIDGGQCKKFKGSLEDYRRWLLERDVDGQNAVPQRKIQLSNNRGKCTRNREQQLQDVDQKLQGKVAEMAKLENQLSATFDDVVYEKFLQLQEEVQRLEAHYLQLL